MEDVDSKLENDNLSPDDIINGNSILKRKRKKIPLGDGNTTDSLASESHTSTSSKGKLKQETSSDQSPLKEKGTDGYYYECVVCDLGGDLLCCDSCPRTYHIECLDPPLEQIPIGKWKCPTCCKKDDSPESIEDLNPTSKRAKTKDASKKSKSRIKSAKKTEKKVESCEINEEKHIHKKEVVLAIESVTKSLKRKWKVPSDDVQKKPRKEHVTSSSSQVKVKQKSIKHPKAKSLSKNMGSENLDIKFKDEVERVLGCRIQANETDSSTNGMPSHSLMDEIPNEGTEIVNGGTEISNGGTENNEEKITGSIGQVMDDSNKDDLEKPTEDVDDKIDVKIEALDSHEKKESLPLISYELLVKWAGKSHIHNTWVPESQLKLMAKRKLDNYTAKYGRTLINICEEKWKLPHRVIALRSSEALVKWTGLPYDECTWEKTDSPLILQSPHLINQFNQFEQQAVEKDGPTNDHPPRGHGDVASLVTQPKYLGGTLFPHQLEALNWLRKCWHKGKNVILADEMGLGKTISASAFLSSLYFEFKARLPSLVLVPLSTMPNWMAEFSLWAPNLNVIEYHGNARARTLIREHEWHAKGTKKIHKFNVLLTTYEMVLADSTHLRGVPWEVLVVDEGHRLKNSESKLFSLLNTFSFQHRVLLTGTPLQNNLGEMYNLLNFLQPDSFPSLNSFEDNFSDLKMPEKVNELKKLVAPHMLRRLKKDAMQNIPPKTERVVPVELSTIQSEYYRAILTKNYHLLRNIGNGGPRGPQQSMLNIVMQLRKVCNHPYLIPGTEPELNSGSVDFLHEMRIKASAKLTLLHSMLKSLHKDGHRVLIFSQMTKLLDILEDYLNIEFGPKTFERVDGSVSISDRQMAIARFNQDKGRFVFLLSTRSCGLGINLASADTVIIYDSDFNPHADIQAMNRAHRIGQSNRLLVYRLFVRASVEERILQLAKKKLMLDHLFVNKSGSQKEVEDIIKWGTEELFDRENETENENENENNGVDLEQKTRKKGGGLGDVYQDKCRDRSSKVVWDESAILKLLDRSNVDLGLTDNGEGDMENDMLGSVKSLDWNEEATEEQGGTEAPPSTIIDGTQNSEKKEDDLDENENEWDRLLRVRWEKYQSEEEAALGRGKRVRKAVSYREAYPLLPSDPPPNQNGGDEEPEPVREYTPAGKALKLKFGKLRARQKHRLAQMKIFRELHPVVGPADVPKKEQHTSLDPPSDKTDPNVNPGKEKEKEKELVQTVLGLCAPNAAKLMEPAHSNFSNRPAGLDFPFHLPPSSNHQKTPLPPFTSHMFVPPLGKRVQASENSADALYLHHEMMMSSLPKLPFNIPDFFPNLTLGRSIGESSVPSFPTIPMFPNFRFQNGNPHENHQMFPENHQMLPENHRRVLESIMMRSNKNNVVKRKLVKDDWSEDELDFLWIGVRRHGRGGWEAMIRDPRLKFSRFRTVDDLAARWEEEQLKIFNIPNQKPPQGSKSGGFPDGMMHKIPFPSGDLPPENHRFLQIPANFLQRKVEEQQQHLKRCSKMPNQKGENTDGGGSPENKLPHWLRKAVGGGSGGGGSQPPAPELPPMVSAIAESVRLLYGDEPPTIPPFIPPGLPPAPPKDPRRMFKKRRHLPPDTRQPDDRATASTSGTSGTKPNLNVIPAPLLPPPAASDLPSLPLESKSRLQETMAAEEEVSSEGTLSDHHDES